MNALSSPSGGLDRGIEDIGRFFPLSREQVDRARGLGMSDEKLSEIANRSERSRVFFGKLRSNSQVFTYLKYLTQKSGPSGSEVEKNSMNEAFISRIIERIEALINELFKQDDIAKNIPYIASYYIEDPDERLWYLHMIGLLDFWRELGRDHSSFGRLPKDEEVHNKRNTPRNEKIFDEARAIWSNYTGRVNSQGLTYSFYSYSDDGESISLLKIGSEALKESSGKEAISHIGRTPVSIGKKYPDTEVALLEEYYMLFGDVPPVFEPPQKLRNQFIGKHRGYFLAAPNNSPWLNTKKILTKDAPGPAIKSGNTGGLQKTKKKATASSPPLVVAPVHKTIDTPQVSAKVDKTLRVFPQPSLKSNLSYLIQNGIVNNVPLGKFIENPQQDTSLWIGIRIGDTIEWRIPGDTDSITLAKPTEETTYVFCFVEDNAEPTAPPEDTNKYPRTEITVSPRTFPSSPPPPPNLRGVIANTQVAVQTNLPSSDRPLVVVNTFEDKTDTLALKIMGYFDTGTESSLPIALSTKGDGTIIGILDTNPIVSFEIATDDAIIFGPKDIIGVDLARLQLELGTYLPSLIRQARSRIEEKKQGEIDTLLLRLSGISRFITHCRELFLEGENDRNSISEIAEECEINGNYSGSIFANRLNAGKLQAFQAILEQKGISLKLIRISEGGFDHKIQICLSDDDQTIYDVSRSQDAPYYHIQKSGPDQDKQVSGFVRALALDAYIILGRAGLQIFKPQNTPIGDSSGLSMKEIESILDGTYEKPKGTFRSLEESEKKLIAQAAARVKEGRLRILKEEASNLSLGIILGAISTVKNIGDFHDLNDDDHIILTDEKLSCLPKEKTKGRIEKWKKRNKGKKISISDHPYKEEYSLLKYHPRSRKYWVRRMIASVQTIAANSRCRYLGLTPFKNEMMVYFGEFWNGLSDEKKREFLIAAANGGSGKPSKALSVLGDDGKNLFDSFILGAEEKYIPIGYSKPQKITKGEILEFIQSEDYKEWSTKIQAGIDLLEEDVFEETPDVE